MGLFYCFLFLFFKFKFIYFNWGIITLQYCIGFAIHPHESATGIHVTYFLNSCASKMSDLNCFLKKSQL